MGGSKPKNVTHQQIVKRILAVKQENPNLYAREIRVQLQKEFEQVDGQGPTIPSISSINRIIRTSYPQSSLSNSCSSDLSISPEPPSSDNCSSTHIASSSGFEILGSSKFPINSSALNSLPQTMFVSNETSFASPNSAFPVRSAFNTAGSSGASGLISSNPNSVSVQVPTANDLNSFGLLTSIYPSSEMLTTSFCSHSSNISSGYGSASSSPPSDLPPSPPESITPNAFEFSSISPPLNPTLPNSAILCANAMVTGVKTSNFCRPPLTSRKYASFNINEILRQDEEEKNKEEDQPDSDEEVEVDDNEDQNDISIYASHLLLHSTSVSSKVERPPSLYLQQPHYYYPTSPFV